MNLSSIISISGQSGLFKIVSQTKNGIIVEPLDGGRRFPVHGAQRVSSLEDISIYTYEEDILLADVFGKIYKGLGGKEAISHKVSADELKGFLNEYLPNYDEERVYVSDIKKLVQWYNLLLKEGLLEEKAKKESGDESKEKSAKKTSTSKTDKSSSKKAVVEKKQKPAPKKGGSTKAKSSTSKKNK